MSTTASYSPSNILETVIRDGNLESPIGNGYGLSNGHVTDSVTWPQKVKLMTPIPSERNISKTAGDAI